MFMWGWEWLVKQFLNIIINLLSEGNQAGVVTQREEMRLWFENFLRCGGWSELGGVITSGLSLGIPCFQM